MIRLSLEDLCANAFIESGEQYLTFARIEAYGLAVVDLLAKEGLKTHLILGRDYTRVMFDEYNDYFIDLGSGVGLKEKNTINNLILKFRGYLSLDVLLAFMNPEATKYIK